MNRLASLTAVVLCLAVMAPAAWAQLPDQQQQQPSDPLNHGNIGVYVDFLRLQSIPQNTFGVGGRIGFNIQRHIVLEWEMSYDFERTQTTAITAGSVTNTIRTNLRMLHGLGGAKIQSTGSFRYFGLLKMGFVNFAVGGPVTAGGINNQLGNIQNGDTQKVFYPGGGVEMNRGKWGIRVEAGDEIMFLTGGASNNIRVAAGPQFRF